MLLRMAFYVIGTWAVSLKPSCLSTQTSCEVAPLPGLALPLTVALLLLVVSDLPGPIQGRRSALRA